MLMQEQPIELVERVAGRMRIPALRHRRHLTLPRFNLSNVRRALAFAAAWRPDRGRERASRRSSFRVAGSRTGPVIAG
jgi:hypothetical protein